jgi:hypothetical protein
MGMVTVMIKTTMKPAPLMEEIAVDLMLILNIAIYVNALKKEEKMIVMMVGLLICNVMISTII